MCIVALTRQEEQKGPAAKTKNLRQQLFCRNARYHHRDQFNRDIKITKKSKKPLT